MANRNFASGGKIFSMRAMPVMVDLVINIGASGAVSSITASSLIDSVEKMATGIYKIHLADTYFSALAVMGSMQSPSVGQSGILAVETQNDPSASVSDIADPSVTIKVLDAAGALADPASGSSIAVMAMLQNSSVRS